MDAGPALFHRILRAALLLLGGLVLALASPALAKAPLASQLRLIAVAITQLGRAIGPGAVIKCWRRPVRAWIHTGVQVFPDGAGGNEGNMLGETAHADPQSSRQQPVQEG